jgi:hypothetical protein
MWGILNVPTSSHVPSDETYVGPRAFSEPETQAEIRRVLEKISGQMGASDQPKHDFSATKATVRKAAAGAPPDEKKIAGFAVANRYEETTVGLAAICKVPLEVVDRMMSADRPDPVLILCKAADFSWTTTRLILLVRPGTKGKSATALEEALGNYEKLSESTAQRVVHLLGIKPTGDGRTSGYDGEQNHFESTAQ